MATNVSGLSGTTTNQTTTPLKTVTPEENRAFLSKAKDKVVLSVKVDDLAFIPPKTYPFTPEKQKLIDALFEKSPMPQKHKEIFQTILSRLNTKRLEELIAQGTKFVVFNKNNIPEYYKNCVDGDRDEILDTIFKYLHEQKLTDIIPGNLYSRETKKFFLTGYLETQKQLKEPDIILAYNEEQNVPINDITDLDIFCTCGGYYNNSNKTIYIPEWNTTSKAFAHELTHALDDAKFADKQNGWKTRFFTNKPKTETLSFRCDSSKAGDLKQLYSEYIDRCTRNRTVIPETFVGPDVWSSYAARFAEKILDGRATVEKGSGEYLAEGGMKYLLDPNALWSADKKMYFFVKQFMEE